MAECHSKALDQFLGFKHLLTQNNEGWKRTTRVKDGVALKELTFAKHVLFKKRKQGKKAQLQPAEEFESLTD